MDFYDVLICDAATETVKSVAGYGLPLESKGFRPSAASVFSDVAPVVRDTLFVEIFEAGKYRAGDKLEVDEARMDRIRRMIVEMPQRRSKYTSRKGDSYGPLQKKRKADCLCIRCGSANLVNAINCEACAQLNRERVSQSKANSL